jgi:hypothetical protein
VNLNAKGEEIVWLNTRKNTRKRVDKSWQSGIVTGDILALD